MSKDNRRNFTDKLRFFGDMKSAFVSLQARINETVNCRARSKLSFKRLKLPVFCLGSGNIVIRWRKQNQGGADENRRWDNHLFGGRHTYFNSRT